MTAEIKLRPHHVARLIEHQDDLDGLELFLSTEVYSLRTIVDIIGIFRRLLRDRTQLIEVIASDQIGADDICRVCNNNKGGHCSLRGGKEILAHESADLIEALRFRIEPGIYTVGELLDRKPAFSVELRI